MRREGAHNNRILTPLVRWVIILSEYQGQICCSGSPLIFFYPISHPDVCSLILFSASSTLLSCLILTPVRSQYTVAGRGWH